MVGKLVLNSIENSDGLKSVDNFVEKSRRMLESRAADARNIRGLQNWVNGNGCLSWEETAYLTRCNDLLSIVPPEDGTAVRFEIWVEDGLVRLLRKLQAVGTNVPMFIFLLYQPNSYRHGRTRIRICPRSTCIHVLRSMRK